MGKSYNDGWRPHFLYPTGDLARLIRAMWSDDFKLRPAMKDVLGQLESCVHLDDVSEEESETAPALHLPFASMTTEQSLQAMVQSKTFEIEKLKARLRKMETTEDSEIGILGGMYEFVPDRERSILGKGASVTYVTRAFVYSLGIERALLMQYRACPLTTTGVWHRLPHAEPT